MILIADSGSSKCDWLLIDENGETRDSFHTIGFNPYFHSSDFIFSQLKESDLGPIASKIRHVFFFGAGSSSESLKKIVENGLSLFFLNAIIEVDHDLTAAAYSTYNGDPSICCILGTGSNSGFFDGDLVHESAPALGHILGDEGSGAHFGIRLLRNYLYDKLPSDLKAEFEQCYQVDVPTIVDKVYRNSNSDVYLATFSHFVTERKNREPLNKWIYEGIKEFLELHVCCFPNHKEVPCHFVGSIGFLLREEIEEIAKELGIQTGNFVRRPVQNLVNYLVKHRLKAKE